MLALWKNKNCVNKKSCEKGAKKGMKTKTVITKKGVKKSEKKV